MAKKFYSSILALISASAMLAGCSTRPVIPAETTPSASPTATAEASASPEATAEVTAEATESDPVLPNDSATDNQTETPITTPAPTPEAAAEPVATAEPGGSTSTVATTSGDDCGWVADYSMADGGHCSLHPEWYGGAIPSNTSSADAPATVTEPTYEAPANYTNASTNLGDAGNITIPDVGIDVALNYGGQAAVNRVNSAAELQYGNEFIADHAYQGFNRITNCVAGTRVYVTRPSGRVDTYQVTAILYTDGVIHYDEYGAQHVYLTDGRDCMNDWIADLCLQTCANGGGDWIVTCSLVY